MTALALNGVTSWEAYATVQLAQACNELEFCVSAENRDWFEGSGTPMMGLVRACQALPTLAYGEALRMIDMVGSGYYGVTLAAASGIGGVNLRPVEFTNIKASEGGGVIVCPFPLHSTLQLPITIWQPVIRHLRSYGMRVRIMGEAGDRMDACSFTEAETLSNLSVRKKLEAIASADLVVGVPCAWMWTTTSWDKKMLVFYPDGIPMERWFPKVEHSAGSNQRWMLYQAWNLQVPIMLSGMKQLLGTL